VEAFKSTLDVVVTADLLVHVVDSSAPDPDASMHAVVTVLQAIGAGDVPQLIVFNKADLDEERAAKLSATHDGSVVVSARTGAGVDELLRTIADRLRAMATVHELLVPFDRGDVLASLHREGEVLTEAATDEGMRVRARLDDSSASHWHEFVVESS
jgi:GTP-binding protein HflX